MSSIVDAAIAPDSWHRRGVEAVRSQQIELAADCFRRAVEASPTNAIYLADLARIERFRGELQTALELFRRAVVAKPGWAPAHYGLAQPIADVGDVLGAIEHFQIAAASKPSAGV